MNECALLRGSGTTQIYQISYEDSKTLEYVHLSFGFSSFFISFIFSGIFVKSISLFHDNFCMNAPIFMNISFFERSPFHLGTIVNFAAMKKFKVCLSVSLSIYLGYKPSKN